MDVVLGGLQDAIGGSDAFDIDAATPVQTNRTDAMSYLVERQVAQKFGSQQLTLQDLLDNPAFAAYCRRNLATETLQFLVDLRRFREAPSQDQFSAMLERYFVAFKSPLELNISGAQRSSVARGKWDDPHVFDLVEETVELDIKQHLPNFLRSPEYKASRGSFADLLGGAPGSEMTLGHGLSVIDLLDFPSFRAFCERRRSLESLNFLLDLRRHKRRPEHRASRDALFAQYITEGSPAQLNIPHEWRAAFQTEDAVQDAAMLEKLRLRVEKNIEMELLPEFLESPEYARSLTEPVDVVEVLHRPVFAEFLDSRFQPELLRFILILRQFKNQPSRLGRTAIVEEFLTEGSRYELSVSGSSKARLLEAEAADCDSFNDVEDEVMASLRLEVFPAFLRSSYAQGAGIFSRPAEVDTDSPRHTKSSFAGLLPGRLEVGLALDMPSFYAFCRRILQLEPLDFLYDLREYRRAPSEASLQALIGTYLAKGAPKKLQGEFHVDDQTSLLHAARDTAEHIVTQELFPEFQKSVEYENSHRSPVDVTEVLHSPAFVEFLYSSGSPQNLQFILKVQSFKRDPTAELLKQIADDFLRVHSPYELSVSGVARNSVITESKRSGDVSGASRDIFQPVEDEVMAMLRTNEFPRFLDSALASDEGFSPDAFRRAQRQDSRRDSGVAPAGACMPLVASPRRPAHRSPSPATPPQEESTYDRRLIEFLDSESFHAFCKRVFSNEPLQFLLDLRSFRRRPTCAAFRDLMDTFVVVGSLAELNIGASHREALLMQDFSGGAAVFDDVKGVVENDMQLSVLPKYLKSPEYEQSLVEPKNVEEVLHRREFADFLSGRLQPELLQFVLALRKFKDAPSGIRGRRLVQQFIHLDAPHELNVSSVERSRLVTLSESWGSEPPPYDIFINVEEEVMTSMRLEVFPAFLASPQAREAGITSGGLRDAAASGGGGVRQQQSEAQAEASRPALTLRVIDLLDMPCFRAFCTRRMQEETLNFLADLRLFNRRRTEAKWRRLLDTYFVVGAQYELNISSADREEILNAADYKDLALFDKVQKVAEKTLRFDALPNFLKSPEYDKSFDDPTDVEEVLHWPSFASYLESTFQSELIQFVLQLRDFKVKPTKEGASELLRQFVHGESQVSISGASRQQVTKRCEEMDEESPAWANIFDDVEEQVMVSLRHDVFPAFKKTLVSSAAAASSDSSNAALPEARVSPFSLGRERLNRSDGGDKDKAKLGGKRRGRSGRSPSPRPRRSITPRARSRSPKPEGRKSSNQLF